MELKQWWADMDTQLKELLMRRFRQGPPENCTVVKGSTPIIAFGEFLTANVATVSLNPSYEEFNPKVERFHTLSTLGLIDYEQIEDEHALAILSLCLTYFKRGVAYKWFSPLENFVCNLVGSGFNTGKVCNMDISPWATEKLWKDLITEQRDKLVGDLDRAILCSLIKNLRCDRIFVNGTTASKSILNQFLQVKYDVYTLPYKKKTEVYYCYTNELFGLDLGRTIEVFGWNFYLQHGVEDNRKQDVISWYKKQSKYKVENL